MAAGQSDSTLRRLITIASLVLHSKLSLVFWSDSNVDNDFLLDTTSGTWDTSRVNWLLDDDNSYVEASP